MNTNRSLKSRKESLVKPKKVESLFADELAKYAVDENTFKCFFENLFFVPENRECNNSSNSYHKMKKILSEMSIGRQEEEEENDENDYE